MVKAPENMKGHKGLSTYTTNWFNCSTLIIEKRRTGVGHLRNPKNAIRCSGGMPVTHKREVSYFLS